MVASSNGYMLTRKGIKTKEDVENTKKLPALEKAVETKQADNRYNLMKKQGFLKGSDGKFKPKEQKDMRKKVWYETTNDVGDKIKIYGVPPTKLK